MVLSARMLGSFARKMISVPTEKGNAMVVDIGEVKRHIKPKAEKLSDGKK